MDLTLISAIFGMAKATTEAAKSAAELKRAVAQFLGLVVSLDVKIDRLLKSELSVAFRTLEQASQSDIEQIPLLRVSRDAFNRAFVLERGYRQGVALLGLAFCHSCLGDITNCEAALNQLVGLAPPISQWSIVWAHFRSMPPMEGESKIGYIRGRIISAVRNNPDAAALLELQRTVGKATGKSLKWWEDLETDFWADRGEKRPT